MSRLEKRNAKNVIKKLKFCANRTRLRSLLGSGQLPEVEVFEVGEDGLGEAVPDRSDLERYRRRLLNVLGQPELVQHPRTIVL